MRYSVQVGIRKGKPVLADVDNLVHAARLATDESDGPLRVYDNQEQRWVSGAEVLLASVKPQRTGN